ncbi:hypothetical protein LX36DRAFT_657274 [Colletotrichum falcatum]|nr:hypothetical protein LX36DRAFT_657274 [Colletotrichum falcatum]
MEYEKRLEMRNRAPGSIPITYSQRLRLPPQLRALTRETWQQTPWPRPSPVAPRIPSLLFIRPLLPNSGRPEACLCRHSLLLRLLEHAKRWIGGRATLPRCVRGVQHGECKPNRMADV